RRCGVAVAAARCCCNSSSAKYSGKVLLQNARNAALAATKPRRSSARDATVQAVSLTVNEVAGASKRKGKRRQFRVSKNW
ncbi:Hypothetical predicted protein, partial [Olea europaea subsp. europaea]